MTSSNPVVVQRLSNPTSQQICELAQVLVDCVEGGASVSFMSPLTVERAIPFWQGVADSAARGERVLMAAVDEEGIVGTVQIVLDLPENQPHRADLAKMLVHRRARRRGVGGLLMQAAEDVAREAGRSLMVLDTSSPEAERLYERQGWKLAGIVPGFALLPQGGLCRTSFYYRELT